MVNPAALAAAHNLASTLKSLRPEYSRPMKVIPLTPDGRSWLLHAERWWPLDEAAIQHLWTARPVEPTRGKIMGREVDFPRRTAAYGVDYKYTGQVQRSRPLDDAPGPLPGILAALRHDAFREHNAVLMNWYDATAKEYMGAHSDDERELIRAEPVVSLSWTTSGHHRRFRFVPKKGVADALAPDLWGYGPGCLPLRNGCLVVMGGQCQTTHKHELMKPTKALGESQGRRINLTLRAFVAAAAHETRKRQRESDVLPADSANAAPPAVSTDAAAAASSAPPSSSSLGSAALEAPVPAREGPQPAATGFPSAAANANGVGDGGGESTADNAGQAAAWACAHCTYLHEGPEVPFLCCRVCGAERSS